MISRVFIFVLLIFFSAYSFSQKYIYLEWYDVDSMLSIIPGQSGEDRINTLNKMATSLFYSDSKLSEEYARQALTLAEEIEFSEGMGAAYRNFGHIFLYQSNYPVALNNYLESLRIYEGLKREKVTANIYYDIAVLHYYAGNYDKALEYGEISLGIFREPSKGGGIIGNVRDTMKVLSGYGLIYGNRGMADIALDIYLEVLEVGENNDFTYEENLLCAFLSGVFYYNLGEPDSAMKYYQKALAYPDISPSIEALKYRPYSWIGQFHFDKGEIQEAIEIQKTTFDWYQAKGFLYMAMMASAKLGHYHSANNNWNSAKYYFTKAEELFDEMQEKNSWYRHDSLRSIVTYGLELYLPLPTLHMKEMLWAAGHSMYYNLYKLCDTKGMTGRALAYLLAYSDAKDTLNMIRRNRETMELQIRYESEQKESQIKYLAQENEFNAFKLYQSRVLLIGLAGLVILILFLAIILVRQNKLREQQKNLLLKQKLFRSQMNPHFIFNSLTSIQKFILEEESHDASKYLSRFSKLIRNILDSSIEEYIPLDEEIMTIENYLELQKLRFDGKFDYTLQVDESIDTDSINIPPMLAQPFIENAIEHGMKHRASRGNIHIRFMLEKRWLIFTVEDDGIGRQKAQEIQLRKDKDHKSLATVITLQRIDALNRKMKRKITLQILDLSDDKGESAGTRVVLRIPVN